MLSTLHDRSIQCVCVEIVQFLRSLLKLKRDARTIQLHSRSQLFVSHTKISGGNKKTQGCWFYNQNRTRETTMCRSRFNHSDCIFTYVRNHRKAQSENRI